MMPRGMPAAGMETVPMVPKPVSNRIAGFSVPTPCNYLWVSAVFDVITC